MTAVSGKAVPSWSDPPDWCDARGPRPIVMVTTSYPKGASDLAGRFVQTLADGLVSRGHLTTVVAPAGGGGRHPGSCRVRGVKVRWVSHPGWRSGLFHGSGIPDAVEAGGLAAGARASAALLPLFRAALDELREAGPRGVIVGHWLVPGGLIAQLASRAAEGTTATTVCHSAALRMVARAPRPLAGAIIRLSVGQGTCVATCAELAAMLEEVGGIDRRQIIEQPMPVEPAVRTGPPGPPPPLKVLAMGRLVPIKGLSQLLDALVDVSDIELHIAGDGPLRADLEAKARRLGVPTIFHGVVVGPAKARLMSSCHGFVLASGHGRNGRTEGFPVSVLEALHYGLPVLATPVGGLVELAAEHPDVTLLGAREPMAAALAAFKATMSAHWASKTDEDF